MRIVAAALLSASHTLKLQDSNGKASTFFWKRGEWFNISEEIAYNINGVSNSHMKKFHVFSNGSLLIRNIAITDEGSYHCRIVSDHTECHGSVTVYLKASTSNSLPYIDRCSPNKGCTIYEELSSTIFLTCKANQVTSDMSLKWFKDSTEITDIAAKGEDKNAMNETIISSTIKIKYGEPQFLTCQASSMKMETAFAHVQLQSEPVHGTSTGIIVFTVVLGVTCAILLGFLLYTFVKQNRDKKTKPDSERPDGETTLFLNEETGPIKEDVDKLKKEISAEQKRTQELRDELSAERAKRLKDEEHKEKLVKVLSAERAKRSMEEKIKEELKETLQKTETDLRVCVFLKRKIYILHCVQRN
ncbi:Signal-regulatory protein beta-1 isoform 3 [Holothuria leucospilota]|uniref:Signal-regulatory protein beta-1 isoform 3 n=1 Tax=Holothuria leucospilota TaxID=206669 RepID=A0A9Q0YFG0_HOLLE|nr:Signal-regulatory protein beta-1 isoform 3 [Holothuria leucospilota]